MVFVKAVRPVAASSSTTWSSMAIAVGDAPPTSFRIFGAGLNASTKGPALFDEQAAADVMSAYREHGVDIAIDLEHLSLDQESRAFDPDARGWCRLEVRGGELWAVDVRWTPDGHVRLSEKRQRYISPAFWRDAETGRVSRITNIAIVAMPATHGAQALVAATARESGARPQEWKMAEGLSIEKLPALAEALGMAADAPLQDVMAALRAIVMAEEGEPAPTETTPDEEPMVEAEDPEAPPAEEDETKGEAVAATARILRLTGRSTLSASLDEVATWRASHLELEQGRAKLQAEQAKLEAGERRTLAGELVKLGVELPSTIFEDASAAKPKLSKRLLDEPIGDLRKRAATWRAAKGSHVVMSAPKSESSQPTETAAELCARFGTDPKLVADIRAKGA